MLRYMDVDKFLKDIMNSKKFSIDTVLLINDIVNKQIMIELPDEDDKK